MVWGWRTLWVEPKFRNLARVSLILGYFKIGLYICIWFKILRIQSLCNLWTTGMSHKLSKVCFLKKNSSSQCTNLGISNINNSTWSLFTGLSSWSPHEAMLCISEGNQQYISKELCSQENPTYVKRGTFQCINQKDKFETSMNSILDYQNVWNSHLFGIPK